jgi:hypothetical protein
MTDITEPAGLSAAESESAREANSLLQLITGYWGTQIVRAAADLSLADHIATGASTPEEIAARESSDAATLFRLMRACVTSGLLTYEGERKFGLTPMGALLRTDVAGSLRDMALVQGAYGHWRTWELLPQAVRQGKTQVHAALGMDLFAYFTKNPEEGSLFAASMSNASGHVVEDVLATVDVSDVDTAVDVGGANGALILAIMEAHPGLRGVLLDLPGVVEGAVASAERLGLGERFTAVAGDFFTEVPAGDLYLIKMILHDWPDESCRTILRNCRAAARPGARAMVVEAVIAEVGKPDWGHLIDINMLAAAGGQERDLGEFDALFAASGWRRVAVTPTRWAQYSIIGLEAI